MVLVFCMSCSSPHKTNGHANFNLRKVASEESRYLFESGFNCEQRSYQTSVGTDLHRLAIKMGFGSLRKAIKDGADVDAPDDSGLTPLHWASWCRRITSTLILIENGADVSAKDVNDNTPLHFVLRPDRYPIFMLVEGILNAGADIKAQNKDGNTPLHLLALNVGNRHSLVVFNKLFKNIASLDALNTQNNEGYTPLHLAVKNLSKRYSLSFVEKLIETGVFIDTVAVDGHTPLSMAISELNPSNYRDVSRLVRTLIDAGADVNFKDKDGNSLLHILINELRSLSEWGVIVSTNIIKYLVDARIVVNSVDKDGNTPLHLAVNPNIVKAELVVKELIKGRATLNARGKGGNTPLHFAAATGTSKGVFSAVKLLLKEGANHKIKNDDGLYPFQMITSESERGIRGYQRRIYNLLYFDIVET